MSSNTASEQILTIMANAINMERIGRTFFLRAAKSAKGEEARQTYLRLAKEEETHIEALEEMFNAYGDPNGWSTYQEILTAHSERLEPITFFEDKMERAVAATTAAEALALAVEHERFAVEFYNTKASVAEDAVARDFLVDLAAMEQEHLHQLQDGGPQ